MTTTVFGSASLLAEGVSDPSFQLTRLACLDREHSLVGNQKSIFLLRASCSSSPVHQRVDSGNVQRTSSCAVERLDKVDLSNSCLSSPSSMLQSVHLLHRRSHVAAISSDGVLAVCPLQLTQVKEEGNESSVSYSFGVPNYTRTSSESSAHGCGYVGLCESSDSLVSAHYLSRRIVWNDLSTLTVTRQCNLFHSPTAVASTYFSSDSGEQSLSSVVVVAEGSNIAVYDERQNNKGGCVYREADGNSGTIWDILPLSGMNRIAASGSDKTIRIYDCRTWKTITKWKAPHKFDVVKMLPSSNSSLQLYVAGRDNEVLLCDVDAQVLESKHRRAEKSATGGNESKKLKRNPDDTTNEAEILAHARDELLPMQLPSSSKLRISHHRGIRAEALWSGLDVFRSELGDRLVGLCGRGKLYVADNANFMKLAI